MPGDVGAVATLLNTVASWLMSEDGYAEYSKRKLFKQLHKQAGDALARGDVAEYRRYRDELERLSSTP